MIRRANHVGRIGEWVEALADQRLVALAFCNAEPTVAPFGGRERRLGTNPLAWAAPRRAPAPALVMDWSTATMAEGKLAVARARGESVADGVLVDSDGEPSNDPAAFYDGGALLPFGAHKGSGLSVMIQLVGGALGGTGVFGERGAARQRHRAVGARPGRLHGLRRLRGPGRGVLRRADRHQAGRGLRRGPRPRRDRTTHACAPRARGGPDPGRDMVGARGPEGRSTSMRRFVRDGQDAPPTPRALKRVVAGATVGTALEWYDFFIFGTAAALVFGDLFFDPASGRRAR